MAAINSRIARRARVIRSTTLGVVSACAVALVATWSSSEKLLAFGSNLSGRRGLLGGAGGALAGAGRVSAEEQSDLYATFTVDLEGDTGGSRQVKVRLHPEWAPKGIRRFKELVNIGEFDDAAVFHVNDNFAHFGLPAEPLLRPSAINDDIVRVSNRRGTLTFASNGPDGRINQLFFNKKDAPLLDGHGYAPIGEVVDDGMEIVDKLYSGYGNSPDRSAIELHGNKYLDSEFPKLSKIKKVEIM